MSALTVLYDACVLYPAPLRSFLMYLAMTPLYRACWTDAIHEEWTRNVLKDYPNFSHDQAAKIRGLMNRAVLNPLVTGYESLIPSLVLPDPDDRHVLAAAIHGHVDLIVTFNLRDFPDESLMPFGIQAQHPDEFIIDQLELSSELVCRAARQQRASLKNPAMSVGEYLASLQRQGLVHTTARLLEHAEWL